MGKLGPRLGSRKKSKRWPRGQSSNSNPTTKKFRSQARSGFFQPLSGPSNLTTDLVKKHDAIQGIPTATRSESDQISVDEDDAATTVGASTFKTFDTFASDYSNCSNVSFSRFLNNFQSNSLMHKEMLAVLSAVTDVIKQNGGTESSTEYFAALMTTLESANTEESIAAILSLLGMGLKTVPKNVLRLQFGKASQVFLQILTKYASEDNFLILRHCIGCLSVLLRAQEVAAWTNSSTLQILDAILVFAAHSKPKVRKAAQHAVCSLLKASDIMRGDNPPAYHPAAPRVARLCLAQLDSTGQPGQITSTLQILSLLKDIAHQLPKSSLKSICEGLLSIMTLNNVLITSCCLQAFHGLFVSRPTEAILPSQLNAQIINALYDYQPAPGDTQPTLAWLAVMKEAHCNLYLHNPELCMANISRIVEKCVELWLSDKMDVLTGASHTLKALLEECVGPACESNESATRIKPILVKIIDTVQQGMKYQYNAAWHHVLHLLATLFKIIGPICQAELTQVLVELGELRDSHKFIYNAETEFAVGAAVRSLGPQVVLKALPIQSANGDIDLKRSWILPVLKDCTTKSSLAFYIDYLLPLADSCEKRTALLTEKKECIAAHSNELFAMQIWALMPSFCTNSPDVAANFSRIARTLGTIISSKKDYRLSVMAALRKLIQSAIDNNNQQDADVLARFAKNYLPLLFNFYTVKPQGSDEEGQRLASYETIKMYLKITPAELIGQLFDEALKNLAESDKTDFFKESIFDLVRLLCQYADGERIKLLYEKCVPLFEDKKHQKEQKKAYRFLEEICKSESKVCQEFVTSNRKAIQKVITRSLPAVLKTSKGPRIRCIAHLVKIHPQLEKTKFLNAIVPEAVMCLKDLNEKCRSSAYNLLNAIADKFLNKEDVFEDYMNKLIEGLGCDAVYCGASLLALSSITYHYNGSIQIATVHRVLDHVCTLVTGSTREVVLSALAYIKVYLAAIPTPTICPMLRKIILALTGMAEDCKRHFRQKVRDIIIKLVRKFGVDVVTSLIPADDPMMLKRLKNIRKIETRKQRVRKERDAKKEEEDESDGEFSVKRKPKTLDDILADSDEDYGDEDEDESGKKSGGKRKAKKKTWIEEGEDEIVDFIDPSAAARSITATKPAEAKTAADKSKKKKNSGFKTASDGRLIICDDSDDDDSDGDERKKKKKSKVPFMAGDSDNEDADEDDIKTVKSSKSMKSIKSNKSSKSIGPGKRKRKLSNNTDSDVKSTSKYRAGGSGIHRPLKARKKDEQLGDEYRSKKAFGDCRKKNKLEPYAYIPLTRASLNKRNKKNNKKGGVNIIARSKKNKTGQISKNRRK